MLKLLTTILLLGSALFANSNELIEDFLEESFSENKALESVKVNVIDRVPIENMKGWDAVILVVNATLNAKPKPREVTQKMIWFTDGNVITKELVIMKTGESMRELINPELKPEHYKKENLVFGNANAKHKVAIFSDPLCPFCIRYVPPAIKYMQKHPDKFALYYYHLPLANIHPASTELAQAAIAAEIKGRKNVILDMYKVKIDSKERDVYKILAAFNKAMDTNLTPADISQPEVISRFKSDIDIANYLMVQGTPTMFFDGKIDKTKKKYQEVK